jgi:hypothetical protein
MAVSSVYSYKYQTQGTGKSIPSNSADPSLSLALSSVNINKITDYEAKYIVRDSTSGEYCIAYYRGEVINDNGITPQPYTTNQDTSFIYNSAASANIYISGSVTSIYGVGSQTLNFTVYNGSASTQIYDYNIAIKINFQI